MWKRQKHKSFTVATVAVHHYPICIRKINLNQNFLRLLAQAKGDVVGALCVRFTSPRDEANWNTSFAGAFPLSVRRRQSKHRQCVKLTYPQEVAIPAMPVLSLNKIHILNSVRENSF